MQTKKTKINDRTPYFFKNKLIDNNIYLAQNTDTFLNGIKISEVWNSLGYNPGSFVKVEEEDVKEFMLYSFVNINNIKRYKVEGKKNELDIKILGYKIKDPTTYKIIPSYTVLLPI